MRYLLLLMLLAGCRGKCEQDLDRAKEMCAVLRARVNQLEGGGVDQKPMLVSAETMEGIKPLWCIWPRWSTYGGRFATYRLRVDLLDSSPDRRVVREETILQVKHKDGRVRYYLNSTTTWITATPLSESYPRASLRDASGQFKEKS